MMEALNSWGLEGSFRSSVVYPQVELRDIILLILSLPSHEVRSLLHLPLQYATCHDLQSNNVNQGWTETVRRNDTFCFLC